jgi:Na+-translocating ferredoxin:NAD+ oxidoreductase RnfE subunit
MSLWSSLCSGVETKRETVRLKSDQTPNEGDLGLLVLLCNQLMGTTSSGNSLRLSLGETAELIHTNASGSGARIFV